MYSGGLGRGRDAREKALEVVERGREVGSLRLEGLGSDVDGRLVRAMGGGAQPERGRAAGPY